MLRVDALHERLARLEEVVARLEGVRGLSLAEFRSDYRHQWLAERGLELGAQALLDIGNHILAGHFGESAPDYEDILRRLGQHGVLSADLTSRLRGLGGFRNVLAHGYLTIDPDKVHAGLSRSRRDFTDFQAEVLAWLDQLPGA